MSRKPDRSAELRAIADGRLMLNVRNGVTVSRSMLAMIADEIDALRAAPLTPAEVGGLVERLRYAENVAINDSHAAQTELSSTPAADNEYADNRAKLCAAVEETISLIQSQAARIAELEAGLERAVEIAQEHVPHLPPDGPSSAEHQAAHETAGFLYRDLFRHRPRPPYRGGQGMSDMIRVRDAAFALDEAIQSFERECAAAGAYMPGIATRLRIHADEMAEKYPDDNNGGARHD